MSTKNESNESSALVVPAEEHLSPREAHALKIWRGTDKPPLAPSLNAKLFNLFLQGKTCEEIRRLNPQLGLGEIVAARLAGDWDARRDEHLDQLLTATSLRVQQATLETADFVCDILAVTARQHGDKLRRYLQNGDENELAGVLKVDSMKQLKEAIEALQKLTGQDRQQVVKQTGTVTVNHQPAEPIMHAARPPAATEAASALKLLLSRKAG